MKRRRPSPDPDATTTEAALLGELGVLFAETDALFAGSSCPASTECCRFGVTGREPYVTSLELAAIARAVARNGGPLSSKRRALPITRDADAERRCPLLDAAGRCSVYASRPFGCRTFFCDRATHASPPPRAAQRALADRLRALAARHAPDGDLTRPLSRALPRDPAEHRGR